MNEKMRVLDLLESGKISADEAAKLIEALGHGPRVFTKENKENIEEKLRIGKTHLARFNIGVSRAKSNAFIDQDNNDIEVLETTIQIRFFY